MIYWKKLTVILGFFIAALPAFSQTMTDEQVIQYVQQEQAELRRIGPDGSE